jgi:DNA-binding CsgD family transcriptional regulator
MSVALSDGDVQALLDFLYEAGDVDGAEVFTEPVLAAFRRLLSFEGGGACNVFGGLDPSSKPERRTVLDFASVGCDWCTDTTVPWTEEFEDACRRLVVEQEAIPPQPRFVHTPLRMSDVLSYRELRAREIYWLVERHFGNDGVNVWLPAPEEGVFRRINFWTERRGGISDRDVRILELLRPHLMQLYRRAAGRRAARTDTSGLTPREYEVMSFVAVGKTNQEIARILWLSPNTVRTHLENVSEKLGVTNRTAATARVFGMPERRPNGNGGSANGDRHASR